MTKYFFNDAYKMSLKLLLLTLIIMASLYGLSRPLSIWLIEEQMSQAGFSQISIEVQYPTWNTWQITHLQAQNDSMKLQVNELILQYSWQSLSSGQLTQVEIESLEISLLNNTEKTNTKPNLSWPVIPMKSIDIKHINVHVPSSPPTLASGSLHFEAKQLQAKLTAHQGHKKSGVFQVSLNSQGQLHINLKKHSKDKEKTVLSADMQCQWYKATWQIKGKGLINLGLIRQSIQTWKTIPDILQAATGTLQGTWDIQGNTAQPLHKLSAQVTTSGQLSIPAKGKDLQNLDIGLASTWNCQKQRCDWVWSKNNSMSAFWQDTKMKVSFPQEISGQFTWNHAPTYFDIQSGQIKLHAFANGEIHSQGFDISPVLQVTQTPQGWEVNRFQAALNVEDLRWQHYQLSPHQLSIDLYSQQQQLWATVNSPNLGAVIPQASINSQVKLSIHTMLTKNWLDTLQSQINLLGQIITPEHQIKGGLNAQCQALNCAWQVSKNTSLQSNVKDIKVQLDLPSGLQGRVSPTVLRVDKGSPLLLSAITINELHISDSTLQLEKDIHVDLKQQRLEEATQFTWSVQEINWQDIRYQSQKMTWHLQQDAQGLQLQLNEPSMQLENQWLTPTPFSLKLNVNHQQASTHANFELQSHDQRLHLKGQMDYQTKKSRLRADVSLEPIPFDEEKPLTQWLKEGIQGDIRQGQVAIKSHVDWQRDDGWKYQGQLQLQDIAGNWQKKYIENFNTVVDFEGDQQQIHSKQPSQMSLATFHAGLPISDISASVAFQFPFKAQPRLHISQAQAHLLGGMISAPQITLDFNKKDNPFELKVQHINIIEMLELSQKQDLFASGELNGQLPMNWNTQGMSLKKGQLSATPAGGRIRYLPSASVRSMSGNSQITMLLDAFSDFNYHLLKADIDYQQDGLMQASIQLSGQNKGFQEGRTVNLNLNYEENLLQLMRSLQIADHIGQRLEERVKETLAK